jgi:hypothetical protein
MHPGPAHSPTLLSSSPAQLRRAAGASRAAAKASAAAHVMLALAKCRSIRRTSL